MKPQEWREQLGECVRDLFRSPEMEQFYSVKLTEKRAQIYLLQLSLYVRKRRDFWPRWLRTVRNSTSNSASCPMNMKS